MMMARERHLMRTTIKEIYATTIRPLPDRAKLQLATLILEEITHKDQQPRRANGDLTRLFGIFNTGDPEAADNEKIDADLARAYLEDYERSK